MNTEQFDFERLYAEFAKHLLPDSAGPNQRRGTQQSFYAGAYTFISALQGIPNMLPPAEAEEVLNRMIGHITKWVEDESKRSLEAGHGRN